jgi:excisionase family DNA binding protein
MTKTELERGAEKPLAKATFKDRKPKPEAKPLLLTVKATSKRLGIDLTRTHQAVEAGQIPSIMIGRRRMVPVAALEQMLANPPEAA